MKDEEARMRLSVMSSPALVAAFRGGLPVPAVAPFVFSFITVSW